MITKKTLGLKSIYNFAGHHMIWLVAWMTIITTLYYFTNWRFLTIPWLPISLIGTAVAFYVGFKNNQSYDRLWEARKIWGAIINDSRMLTTMIKNLNNEDNLNLEITDERKRFVHRHIAYLYQLRSQLLEPTQWEHVSLGLTFGSYNQRKQNKIFQLFNKDLNDVDNQKYLNEDELFYLSKYSNKATQIIDIQTNFIQNLYYNKQINLMQQMELQRVLNNFYDHQGKAERIKKFPLPRQYGSFSFVFVSIFVFLLPFGIVGEINKLGEGMIWLSIPIGTIVGWVYVVMEMIGDYSENPFEGLSNDIPMLSICRTIEIDLLQMIGEETTLKPITAKNNILM